jgi:hypothetical protein
MHAFARCCHLCGASRSIGKSKHRLLHQIFISIRGRKDFPSRERLKTCASHQIAFAVEFVFVLIAIVIS